MSPLRDYLARWLVGGTKVVNEKEKEETCMQWQMAMANGNGKWQGK